MGGGMTQTEFDFFIYLFITWSSSWRVFAGFSKLTRVSPPSYLNGMTEERRGTTDYAKTERAKKKV